MTSSELAAQQAVLCKRDMGFSMRMKAFPICGSRVKFFASFPVICYTSPSLERAARLRVGFCACVTQTGEDRDVENRLVQLLDFDKFELIKELLKNRLKIVWCTRLQRAQAEDERARIEVRGLCCPVTSACSWWSLVPIPCSITSRPSCKTLCLLHVAGIVLCTPMSAAT